MIYLDNAATTYPKPPEVMRAVSEAAEKYFANPGRGNYPAAAESEKAVYSARAAIAKLLGAENPENIIFTANCTTAINYVLKGCLMAGDHVIISDMEHNAVVRPLHMLEKKGVSVTRVHCFGKTPCAVVREFERALRYNTKMIFCTHASNVFGNVMPVEALGRLCRARGLIFGIDAAQSAGLLPLTFPDTQADFICLPAHKGLYGIMGLGVLASSGRIVPESIIEGGTGSFSARREQPDYLPDRLESGTLNLPGICALKAGIEAVEKIGVGNIYRHEIALISYLYRELARMKNVILYTPAPQYGMSVPLLSFNVENMPSERAAEYLAAENIAVRAGYHCAYDAHIAAGSSEYGTVRVCPSMYTSRQDMDMLLRAVYKIL